MTTRILYSQQTQTGKLLAQAVSDALVARASMRRVQGVLDSASAAADWASVAAEVGGGITAQQAQDLWTIFSTAKTSIDSPQVAELSRLDQG